MPNLKHLPISLLLILGMCFVVGCQTGVNDETNLKSMVSPLVESTPLPRKRVVDTPITIAAGGDMMLGSPFPNASRMPPNDGKDLLKLVAPIFQEADIAFGNLEGPLADGGVSPKCGRGRRNCFAFRMPTRYANYLKDAGFDVMSVANNHALDFGDRGRASTRATLDRLGIKHAGSDRRNFSTAYLDVNSKKIAFIGFAHNGVSLNVNELAAARRAVEQADRKADIVVVSFHGGAEGATAQRVPHKTEIFYGERRGNLRLFAKTVVDAGADLVLGHGPHVLRGMEIYKGRLVAYSLGNFVTYGWFKLIGGTAETLVLNVKLSSSGKFLGAKIHPFVLRARGILTPDKTKSAIFTIRRLSSLDFPLTAPEISNDGLITSR